MTENSILTVSQLSLSLKACVEQVFSAVRVRGEISGLKIAASGHAYFSLKDENAVLSAVCWKGRTSTALQEGLEVVCTGKLSTYPGRSNYQLIVETTEPAGVGALLKLLNERKEKLEKEGLFNPLHKKKIPFLPTVIGVVTSPTGAVIRDIIHRISERFPTHLILWPVLVQGTEAPQQITEAIQGFNAIDTAGITIGNQFIPRPDVLIVARGGGSLEDLWGFNDEAVVRSVFASKIPVISAVGHETDTTLIDYVSDLRAPTPTGAAEKAVPVKMELVQQLLVEENRLNQGIYNFYRQKEQQVKLLEKSIPNLTELVQFFMQRLDDYTERLTVAGKNLFSQKQWLLEKWGGLLESYSYQKILERGFAFVSNTDGHILNSANKALKAGRIEITFYDGKIAAQPIKDIAPIKKESKSKESIELPLFEIEGED